MEHNKNKGKVKSANFSFFLFFLVCMFMLLVRQSYVLPNCGENFSTSPLLYSSIYSKKFNESLLLVALLTSEGDKSIHKLIDWLSNNKTSKPFLCEKSSPYNVPSLF